MESQNIKIFLADDHHVFRAGIRVLLEHEFPVTIVGEAATGEEVLTQLDGLELDLILLDINMPGMDGMTLMEQLSLKYPELPVLVLSSYDDDQYINHMMKNGARGYILKNCRKDELFMAIKTVKSGASFMGKGVSEKLIHSFGKKEKDNNHKASTPLTNREVEILKLVAKGLTNKEIGKKLFISNRTVDTHRRNMMTKLDLHNAAALSFYASRKGLFDKET